MSKKQKKKPRSKLETTNTIVQILAGIANVVFVIYQMFQG